MNFKCSIILAMLFTMCSGCDMSSLAPGADEKFGDQNFKSAVAMIELHRARNGEYPASLSELEYLGDWDAIWLSSVKYEKVENGYNLFVTRGWMGEPKLELPGAYKRGLGIRDTNVTWATEE